MSIDQIVSIASGIREHMAINGKDRAEIHFIGGEPTMMGLAWFEEAIPAFRSALGDAFVSDISMVSNLISDDIVAIARLFDRVSTSWEPETRFISINGNPRPKIEAKWRESVALLQMAGVDLSVTTAITKPVTRMGAERVLDYLCFEVGIQKVHFGFFIPEGDGLSNINQTLPRFVETSDFLIGAATWAMARRNDLPGLWVNPFESMLSSINDEVQMEDIVCPMVSGSLDIHWDGQAASCLEAGGGKSPQWVGNVFTEGVVGVTQTVPFYKSVAAARRGHPDCYDCDEFAFCNSSCGVLARYAMENAGDCHGFKKFIKHVRAMHEIGVKPKQSSYGGRSC